MATWLRRLLFGAPLIARVAPHSTFSGRLSRLSGDSAPSRWTTAATLETGWPLPSAPGAPPAETVLLLIQDPEQGALPDLQLARSLGADVRAVYVDDDPGQTRRLLSAWARSGDGVPLLILEGDGLPVAASLRAYVDLLARERTSGEISLVLPACETGACRAKIRSALRSSMVRLAFGGRPGVRVYSGGLARGRSERTLTGCPVEA